MYGTRLKAIGPDPQWVKCRVLRGYRKISPFLFLNLCYVSLMSWAKEFTLSIPKPNTEAFAPAGGWNAAVPPVSPWTVGAKQPVTVQAYQTDENLKKQFGIELAKSANPFEAGCKVFGEETNKALWASFSWLSDPIVVASRDIYLKTLELSSPTLDREQLAAKVLALADEKVLKNGVLLPTIEAKDRVAALKLYSDIMGFTGKVEIDNSTKNILNNNTMVIKLVKGSADTHQIINNKAPNVKSELVNENAVPITLKLVGGVSR